MSARPEPGEPIAADLRDYVDFATQGASSRRVFSTDLLAVDVVCLDPGQHVGARELAEADVVYTVLGGRAWIVTPDAEAVLEPLQALLVPAGVTHGLRNDGADPLILQASASPSAELPALHEGPARRPVHRGQSRGGAGRRSALDRLRGVFGTTE